MRRIPITVLCVIILGIFFYATSAPKNFPPANVSFFTILPGKSLKSVGTELKDGNYIRSRFLFATFATCFGGEHRLSLGDYYFPHPRNVIGMAFQIARGDHNLKKIKVTLPEGKTVQEMAVIYAQKLPFFDSESFLIEARDHEGYLFPETYFFYPKTSASEIIKDMLAMFDSETKDIWADPEAAVHSKNDIVTMASIIEREAHGDDDRAVISGILWKRIAIGMPLQVDASTVYNTYKNKGLPPAPIASPGLAAIKAAINPTASSYLYYLHDSHGTIHYAKIYAEHQANIAKYLR